MLVALQAVETPQSQQETAITMFSVNYITCNNHGDKFRFKKHGRGDGIGSDTRNRIKSFLVVVPRSVVDLCVCADLVGRVPSSGVC